MTTKQVNFYTVYNDFGDTLPDKSAFFNDPRNEVSRVMLRYRYWVDSDCRAFKLFKEEYAKFVTELKAKAKAKAQEKAKPDTTQETQDEAK